MNKALVRIGHSLAIFLSLVLVLEGVLLAFGTLANTFYYHTDTRLLTDPSELLIGFIAISFYVLLGWASFRGLRLLDKRSSSIVYEHGRVEAVPLTLGEFWRKVLSGLVMATKSVGALLLLSVLLIFGVVVLLLVAYGAYSALAAMTTTTFLLLVVIALLLFRRKD